MLQFLFCTALVKGFDFEFINQALNSHGCMIFNVKIYLLLTSYIKNAIHEKDRAASLSSKAFVFTVLVLLNFGLFVVDRILFNKICFLSLLFTLILLRH